MQLQIRLASLSAVLVCLVSGYRVKDFKKVIEQFRPRCAPFSRTFDGACIGSTKTEWVLLSANAKTDLECGIQCRDMTEKHGKLCCLLSKEKQCRAHIGAIAMTRYNDLVPEARPAFVVTGCGLARANGKWEVSGSYQGRPEYKRVGDDDFVIHWSEKKKTWRLFVEGTGHTVFGKNLQRPTLYESKSESHEIPDIGWEVVDGDQPAPRISIVSNDLEVGSVSACDSGDEQVWHLGQLKGEQLFLTGLDGGWRIGDEPISEAGAASLQADTDFMEPALFRAILPTDVMQGKLGDCWLAAAMSCFARFPWAVRKLFRQQHLTSSGIYELQLYDIASHMWVRIVVDDVVPRHEENGKAKYTKVSHMKEIWPVLLQKAFAKFVSRRESFKKGEKGIGFNALRGGKLAWAFSALTGVERPLILYNGRFDKKPNKNWRSALYDPFAMAREMDKGTAREVVLTFVSGSRSKMGVWKLLQQGMTSNWLMGVSIPKPKESDPNTIVVENGEVQRSDGLYGGHAYSILGVEELTPDTHHKICEETVRVDYNGQADEYAKVQAMLEDQQEDGSRLFRGWGPGDSVWCHYFDDDGTKNKSHLKRFTALRIASDDECEGEACVHLSSVEEGEARESAPVPLSWVKGRRLFSYAESMGVRAGWKLIHESNHELVFKGVVDKAICAKPEGRSVELRDGPKITTLQKVTRLVRVRNPWGNGKEYNGKWSDENAAWNAHPDVAEAMAYDGGMPDGAWWMGFNYLERVVAKIEIARTDMTKFNPTPVECNTDWGAAHFRPYDYFGRVQIAWPDAKKVKKLDLQPNRDACAWCVWQQECEEGQTGTNTKGSQTLCCKIAFQEVAW